MFGPCDPQHTGNKARKRRLRGCSPRSNAPVTKFDPKHGNGPDRRLVTNHAIANPERMPGVGVGIAALDVMRLVGSQRIGIIGLPGTGKSTCCKSLLAELCYSYPIINVFSGSEGENPFYSDMIPKLFIQNKISQRGLKMFVNRQRLAINYDSPLKDALLILDDCFETPQQGATRTDSSHPPASTGQQHHAHSLQAGPSSPRICLGCAYRTRSDPIGAVPQPQYVVDLKPYARSTTSAVFLFHCPSSRDRRLLFENYGSVFADYAAFSACYNSICDRWCALRRSIAGATPHTAMVILLNQGNRNILDTVFWYRPQLIPDGSIQTARRLYRRAFALCHPVVWDHARPDFIPCLPSHKSIRLCGVGTKRMKPAPDSAWTNPGWTTSPYCPVTPMTINATVATTSKTCNRPLRFAIDSSAVSPNAYAPIASPIFNTNRWP